jgi:hypothetical protein
MLLRLGFSLHELLSQTTDLVAAVVLDAHVHGPDLPMTDAEAAALLDDDAPSLDPERSGRWLPDVVPGLD